MGAIGLAGLALLAESQLAVALDGVRRGRRRILRREEAVAHIVRRGAGGSKDGRGVAPVEQEVEGDADGRGAVACGGMLVLVMSSSPVVTYLSSYSSDWRYRH